MKLIILGCGTSTGVPLIGCRCGVCTSTDARNKRTRSSALIEVNGRHILIDTSTDLRQQALANSIERVDAVLFTHPHADHIHGIDDLRSFNMAQGFAIDCYGNADTIGRIRTMFNYIFREDSNDGWKPELTLSVKDGPFELYGERVTPVPIRHGAMSIYGWRVRNAAYLTDCSAIPPDAMDLLKGLDVLVIGALRAKPHPTHFTIQQAIDAAQAIGAKRTILTHTGHNIDYVNDSKSLPDGVEFAYDGMVVELA
ncbi:MAG: MBL fold metallo-hydrolase [Deltaproteobacteria bacterium RIFCSPLOWO2_02_FULL_53_8]|nr:MAG: MBL fold metallo-hydrolase [Deltaproteobacteria bacterium RIFCSPLOWO2_02_FULL_53_8]